jgi:hypothetical protein
MELQIGDRLTDETGDYEIIGRPYTTQMGKNVHVRVKRGSPLPEQLAPGPDKPVVTTGGFSTDLRLVLQQSANPIC